MGDGRDKELLGQARKAAEDLALALNKAANAGLLLECSAQANGTEHYGNHLVKQSNWIVRVFARRVIQV